jgi:hypothetical protein
MCSPRCGQRATVHVWLLHAPSSLAGAWLHAQALGCWAWAPVIHSYMPNMPGLGLPPRLTLALSCPAAPPSLAQWVFDSANFRVLMPCDMYAPGSPPPPHLSPFINDEEEGYTPDFALQVKRLQVRNCTNVCQMSVRRLLAPESSWAGRSLGASLAAMPKFHICGL